MNIRISSTLLYAPHRSMNWFSLGFILNDAFDLYSQRQTCTHVYWHWNHVLYWCVCVETMRRWHLFRIQDEKTYFAIADDVMGIRSLPTPPYMPDTLIYIWFNFRQHLVAVRWLRMCVCVFSSWKLIWAKRKTLWTIAFGWRYEIRVDICVYITRAMCTATFSQRAELTVSVCT